MQTAQHALIAGPGVKENGRSPVEIEIFLNGLLSRNRSLAKRAYAAWFIGAHRGEIEKHLQRKVKDSGASYVTQVWARKLRKLIAEYSVGPQGYTYNPKTGSLVARYVPSFRLTPCEASLTIHTLHNWLRLIGYLVAFVLIALFLWCGLELSNAIDRADEEWGRFFEQWLNSQ